MKPAQIKALRQRLTGEVSDAKAVREYFATDASVFTLQPAAVAYPQDVTDVQVAVTYAAEQAAKKGKGFSITARGRGTDLSGGALGDGLMMVLPAHMNRVLRLTKNSVTVQPGLTFGALLTLLRSHGRWLPCAPGSRDFASVGGAVANNSAGETSAKYGPTAAWVTGLKVVLDDGSLIEARRYSRREVHRKKGLMTREGDLYRGLDGLLKDHAALIQQQWPKTAKNVAGYQLPAIRGRDGSVDLTQLFIGAQGTLGIITEITFKTMPHQERTTTLAAQFNDLESASTAALKLARLNPSAMEWVGGQLLEQVRSQQPERLAGLLGKDLPRVVLLVQFDNPSHLRQNLLGRRAARVVGKSAASVRLANTTKEQEQLWGLRQSALASLAGAKAGKHPVPLIEDAAVPLANLTQFLEGVAGLLKKHKLEAGLWGGVLDGNFHLQPALDLSKAKDRKLAPKLMDDFYNLVIQSGGTTTARHGDGLLRAPYLEKVYGKELYGLLKEIKELCDPHGIFNPRAKFGTTKADQAKLLRRDYGLGHLHDHVPYR